MGREGGLAEQRMSRTKKRIEEWMKGRKEEKLGGAVGCLLQ